MEGEHQGIGACSRSECEKQAGNGACEWVLFSSASIFLPAAGHVLHSQLSRCPLITQVTSESPAVTERNTHHYEIIPKHQILCPGLHANPLSHICVSRNTPQCYISSPLPASQTHCSQMREREREMTEK